MVGKGEHKTKGFHLSLPSAILMCFTYLSLRFLYDTSVKMFFLINNLPKKLVVMSSFMSGLELSALVRMRFVRGLFPQ